jgi:putative glutamine amidotransferase
MSKPLIGITLGSHLDEPDFSRSTINDVYSISVAKAGGIPVLIPVATPLDGMQDLRRNLQGLILTGGPDLDPDLYGGVHHPKVYGVDQRRDALDMALIHMAFETGLPILGICRGFQAINIAMGGKLLTHLADQLPGALKHDCHPDHPRNWLAHEVKVEKGSQLEKIVGSSQPKVNSMHHQGVFQVPASLRALAYASDGVVESVELPGHPFALGVQWHPECLQEYPDMQNLFRALVQAAQKLIA